MEEVESRAEIELKPEDEVINKNSSRKTGLSQRAPHKAIKHSVKTTQKVKRGKDLELFIGLLTNVTVNQSSTVILNKTQISKVCKLDSPNSNR